jgi:hypothetical protein
MNYYYWIQISNDFVFEIKSEKKLNEWNNWWKRRTGSELYT